VRSPQRARRAADDSMRRAADHGSPPALHASVHNGARCGGLPTTARPLPCMQVPITALLAEGCRHARTLPCMQVPTTALLAEGFPSVFRRPRSQGAPWWALACPPERRPSTLLEHALARTCNLSAATERMCLDAARASARRPHAPSPSPSCQRPRPQASTRICDVAPHEKSRLQHSGFT
jgi:hypothetical protein